MDGLSAAIQRRLVEFSNELDRDGVSLTDQVAAFGGMLMLALAAMPPDAARMAAAAHIEAIREILDDPSIAAAGAIMRQLRRRQ